MSKYTRFNNNNYAAIGIKNGNSKLIEIEASNTDEAYKLAKKYFDKETEISIAPIPEMVVVIGDVFYNELNKIMEE